MIKIKQRTLDGDVAVLRLEGKLSGLEGRGLIQDRLKKINQDTKEVKNIILDLEKVSWIDSTGLGELIASLSSVKKNGGNMVLANIPGPVNSLLSMTNLNQIFDTYENIDTALAELKSS